MPYLAIIMASNVHYGLDESSLAAMLVGVVRGERGSKGAALCLDLAILQA